MTRLEPGPYQPGVLQLAVGGAELVHHPPRAGCPHVVTLGAEVTLMAAHRRQGVVESGVGLPHLPGKWSGAGASLRYSEMNERTWLDIRP
jgi:hypothetical protein